MIFIILCIFIIIILIFLIYKRFFPKKKVISIDNLGIIFNIISLFLNKHVSDINKNNYISTFDKIIKRIDLLNSKGNITFTEMNIFEMNIWKFLTQGKYYYSHKIFLNIVINIINKDYKIAFYYIFINIYRIPLIIYELYSDSLLIKEKFLANLGLLETIIKVYQISIIMNVSLETVIKRIRLFRNIPIIDKKTGKKMITRQVKYPMVGSEVCPYINYINKSQINNITLHYSVIIIEKDIMLGLEQYSCKYHKTCVVYKNKKGVIKHLEQCEFWYNEQYWKEKYPKEKELINS